MLWKCCKNIVDVALFFFFLIPHLWFRQPLFFFSPILDNGIATIAKFFFSYFGNAIATFGFPCAHSHFEHPLGQQVWAEGILVMVLPKIKNFSLPLFLFLSSTFVEFRQWYCQNYHCRNLHSFFRFLNKLEQYL